MNFNTLLFLLVFLPVVWGLFYLAPRQFRVVILLVASLIFYGAAGGVPLAFMVLAIFWGYLMALIVGQSSLRSSLLLSISVPLIILFMLKYLNFTLDNLGLSSDAKDQFIFFLSITLPAGISFYTFQIVSYNIDVFDKKFTPERNFTKFATFISLFPQLIAGPILRYNEMSSQLDRIKSQQKLNIDFRSSFKFISVGLFAKICISDLTWTLIKNSMGTDLARDANFLDIVFLLNSYSIRIFYDFWAYSLMAIGIAKLFSLNLPINFREPYQALNPRDFWRRWHVTLSYWLRDYLYVKMGGNRSYIRNIGIVFVVCGVWHGAGWSFIIWGAYHAILVIFYQLSKSVWDKLFSPVQVILTYLMVALGWPLFFLDIDAYLTFITIPFNENAGLGIYKLKHWLFIAPIILWTFFSREKLWLYNETPRLLFDSPIVHGMMFFIALIFANYSDTFVYFRF